MRLTTPKTLLDAMHQAEQAWIKEDKISGKHREEIVRAFAEVPEVQAIVRARSGVYWNTVCLVITMPGVRDGLDTELMDRLMKVQIDLARRGYRDLYTHLVVEIEPEPKGKTWYRRTAY